MSAGRRGFFAFVGSAAVTGLVSQRADATKPLLILPPKELIAAPAGGGQWPLLAAERSQMEAICEVKAHLPEAEFRNWLEGGLRLAKFWNGRDEATMARLLAEGRLTLQG